MPFVSVAEAAELLGVSVRRVRQRIADGSLPAQKVGNQWNIDKADLAPSRISRPMSRRMAWAFLRHLGGESPLVSASERHRLKSRSRDLADARDPAAVLRSWLSSRAQRLKFGLAPADLADLRAEPRLVLSGLSARHGGIVAPQVVEGYVAAANLDPMIKDYFLVPSHDRGGNVILHVVAEADEQPADFYSAWPVVAADLAEHSGARERARVRELVREALD